MIEYQATRFDVVEARDKVIAHQAEHGCFIGDGCHVRVTWWLKYQYQAELYGLRVGEHEAAKRAHARLRRQIAALHDLAA